MANKKSAYTQKLFIRLKPGVSEYLRKQVPERFVSLSAAVSHMIELDRKRTWERNNPRLVERVEAK